MRSLAFVFICLFLGILLHSCREDPENENDTKYASDVSWVRQEFDQAMEMSQDCKDGDCSSFTGGRIAACATVTVDAANQTVLLDFGSGCTGIDGRTRSGKIKIKHTPGPISTSTQTEIEFISYSVDSYTLEGLVKDHQYQRNTDGNWQYQRIVSNGIFGFPTNEKIHFEAQHSITWTAGEGSLDLSTYEFKTTGNSSGITRNGKNFQVQILTPYHHKFSCLSQGIVYPVSGSANIKVGVLSNMVLDYGQGACDKQATLTYRSKVYNLNLP